MLHPISLDAPIDEENGTDSPGRDFLSNNEDEPECQSAVLKSHRREVIQKAMAVLSPKEIKVLSLHYGLNRTDGMSFNRIGRMIGASNQHVSKIEQTALRKIKRFLKRSNITAEMV